MIKRQKIIVFTPAYFVSFGGRHYYSYEKQYIPIGFCWLSLVIVLMVSFLCCPFSHVVISPNRLQLCRDNNVGKGTLPAQLGQLKTGHDGNGLLRIHRWGPDDLLRLWDRIE